VGALSAECATETDKRTDGQVAGTDTDSRRRLLAANTGVPNFGQIASALPGAVTGHLGFRVQQSAVLGQRVEASRRRLGANG
jgi:hypothetical protein